MVLLLTFRYKHRLSGSCMVKNDHLPAELRSSFCLLLVGFLVHIIIAKEQLLPLFNVFFHKQGQAGTVFPINILCGTIWVFLTVIDQPCIPSSVFSHINTQVVSFEAQEINVWAQGRIIFVLIFPLGTRSPENSTMYSPLKHSLMPWFLFRVCDPCQRLQFLGLSRQWYWKFSSIWKSLIFSLISEWMNEWKPF